MGLFDGKKAAGDPPKRGGLGKRLATIVVALVFVSAALGNCGKQQAQPTEGDDRGKAPVASKEKPEREEPKEIDQLGRFVDEYNAIAETPITPVERFDPHDSSGTHYKREFRLQAFDGSLGLAGTCGDLSVQLVNYGSYGGYYSSRSSFRAYASGPYEQVIEFYRVAARVLDPNVSDASIDEAVEYALSAGGSAVIKDSTINPTILSAHPQRTSEAMLDTGKYAAS
ncbi:hypothetical protein [Olsenella urininfantis]|uniref:hypothetical protein n=1 Tax=Olsenella urininfantis TaxID=1871033 RepID=UPI0009875BAB|nr:hypothetical protein [Olsenella urininfantis]